MWFTSLINQITVLGEVNTDIVSLRIVGVDKIADWDDLMLTALSNRRRARLKTGVALMMFLAGITVMAALISDVRLLHSIFNVLTSVEFFGAGFLFLLLSYHDRGMYRVSASSRIKQVAQRGGVE
jgi:hypothetical protein